MPEQAKPIAILREKDGAPHQLWLDQGSQGGDIDLTLDSPVDKPIVPGVSGIISSRLARAVGSAPEVETWPSRAYFAYPDEAGVPSKVLFTEAENTLLDLQRECDGSQEVSDVLDTYRKRLRDEERMTGEITATEILELKPVLHKNEVEDVVTESLRTIRQLSQDQKGRIASALATNLGDYARPPVMGASEKEIAKNVGSEEGDILFMDVQRQVAAQLPGDGNAGLRHYVTGLVYDALQDAYADRARDMQP